MSIWVITVSRTPDTKKVDWMFDVEEEYNRARKLAAKIDPYYECRIDYLTSFDEFEAWTNGET